jgi:hypothetical protein
MAAILTIYDGQTWIETGWGELPWPQCVKAFGLDHSHWSAEEPVPGKGNPEGAFPDRVVVEIKSPEAEQEGIRPGYYLSPMSGQEAKSNLDDTRAAD